MLYENFKDILRHTYSLGYVDFVKLENDTVKAIADDRSFVIRGTLNKPIPEMDGNKVGLSNLSTLRGLVEYPPFQEPEAEILIHNSKNQSGVEYPREVEFKSAYNHAAKYIMTSAANADRRVKIPRLDRFEFEAEITPSKKNLKDLSYFTKVLGSESKLFKASLSYGKLEFHLGDDHGCQTVIPIADDVYGEITKDVYFPLQQVLAILKLGEKTKSTLRVGNKGMEIIIDSGVGVYHYYIPTKRKK